jgi:hypothetical protein
MSIEVCTNEEVSLWDCLHDGGLESLTSDTLARSVTIRVDVPYIWDFHSMPSESRFRLVLEGVRLVEALQFASWPGEFIIPEGISWDESEKLRREYFSKGRLESIDWQTVAVKLEHTEEHEISNATLNASTTDSVTLQLDLMDDTHEEYPELRIAAEKLRIFINEDRELSLEEFLALGEAYWTAFAERSASRQADKHGA